MVAPRKSSLEQLAQEAQDALDMMVGAGYEAEVVAVRKFIAALGDSHRKQMKMQHRIAAEIVRGK